MGDGWDQIPNDTNIVESLNHLVHLARCTKLFGPLWAYTCFPFEGYNQIITRSIKGTYRIERGISRSIGMYQYTLEKVDVVAHQGLKLLLQGHVSKPKEVIYINDYASAFSLYSSDDDRSFYRKLLIRGRLFEAYDHVKQRQYDNSLLRLRSGDVARLCKVECHKSRGWRLHCMLLRQGQFGSLALVNVCDVENWVIALYSDNVVVNVVDVFTCIKRFF